MTYGLLVVDLDETARFHGHGITRGQRARSRPPGCVAFVSESRSIEGYTSLPWVRTLRADPPVVF
jgi:hypothetical protein